MIVDEISPQIEDSILQDSACLNGGFNRNLYDILKVISRVQKQHKVEGNIMEFGSYFGSSFAPFALLTGPNEQMFAIDGFDIYDYSPAKKEDVQLSVDKILGPRKLKKKVSVLAANRSKLTVSDVKQFVSDETNRICHLRGRSQPWVVENQMEIAFRLMTTGGVVSMDNYNDILTPEVIIGFYQFAKDKLSSLYPVVTAPNLIFLTDSGHVCQAYQEKLVEFAMINNKRFEFHPFLGRNALWIS